MNTVPVVKQSLQKLYDRVYKQNSRLHQFLVSRYLLSETNVQNKSKCNVLQNK